MSRRSWLTLAAGLGCIAAFVLFVFTAGDRAPNRSARSPAKQAAKPKLDQVPDRFAELILPPAATAPAEDPEVAEVARAPDAREKSTKSKKKKVAEKTTLKFIGATGAGDSAIADALSGSADDVDLGAVFGAPVEADEELVETEEEKEAEDQRQAPETLVGESGQAVPSRRSSRGSRRDAKDAPAPVRSPPVDQKPASFMPRTAYFENTYLGGNAAHAERLRRLGAALGQPGPHLEARLPPQPFDPPGDAGLALTAALDRVWLDEPGRVVLQVGLQGSRRFGWRRPPLDVVLVIDQPVTRRAAQIPRAVEALRARLGPRDRLGVVLVGRAPRIISSVLPVDEARRAARATLTTMRRPPRLGPRHLGRALQSAGAMLREAAGAEARVPGSQTVLLLTYGGDAVRVGAATKAVHALTLQGAVTSVIDLAPASAAGPWWSVAAAGHGNHHRAEGDVAVAVNAELDNLSRVIGRLLRINVRLAPNVEAIRVIGSRVLEQQEVVRVKAREVATDRNLSATLGVKADRGEDDDGIQTVIPYFYGGDSHVVLLELWVEKPGPVADVSLRYKDMVALDNATARAGVTIGSLPRAETPLQRSVRRNVQGFEFATALAGAAGAQGPAAMRRALQGARRVARGGDLRMVEAFERATSLDPRLLRESLTLASRRRIGHSAAD